MATRARHNISSKGLVWDSDFDAFRRDLDEKTERAVNKATQHVAEVIAGNVARGQKRSGSAYPKHFADDIYADKARRTRRGWFGAVKHTTNTFWGLFLEEGTLGKRTKKLKDPGKRSKATTKTITTKRGTTRTVKLGIKPRRYMKKGLKEAGAAELILDHLEREMR